MIPKMVRPAAPQSWTPSEDIAWPIHTWNHRPNCPDLETPWHRVGMPHPQKANQDMMEMGNLIGLLYESIAIKILKIGTWSIIPGKHVLCQIV